MAVSQKDVDAWAEDAGRMRYQIHNFDAGDERAAREAIANFLSEHGYEAAVVEMFGELLENGYLLALRDVRDGEFDGELEEWGRPDTGSGSRPSASAIARVSTAPGAELYSTS